MDNQLKSNGKGVSWRHSVWIFFKAQISAQFASFVDFLVTILLVKAFAVFYLYATFTGSVVGGIVNCAIITDGCPCRRLQENACCRQVPLCLGRQHYTECLGYFCIDRVAYRHDMVNGLLGYYIDNVFILSKIIVAVLVAFFLELPSATFFSFIVITI